MKRFLIGILLVLTLLTIAAAIYNKPFVERSSCVGCGDCELQCPTDAIALRSGRAVIDPDLCIDCKICVRTCTFKAIKTPK